MVKRYGRSGRPAVDGLSFAVRRGEVFGLLGPNGAGKTTTVGVLTTRVTPTSGRATVAGIDVAADPVAARAVLGVVPQRPNLDRSLDARGNLVWHAAYHGVPRARRGPLADELLERMGLTEKASTNPDELSGGQAQRLIIARGLMHDPQVLFLDEPSTGLDPQARLFVHDRVTELAASGVTVVLTTHDMDEAAKLADRVGIVDHGKLLALDSPDALVAGLPGEATIDLVLTGADAATVRGRIDGVRGVAGVDDRGGEGDDTVRLRVRVDGDAGAALAPVLGAVAGTGATVGQVDVGEPTLEDVFIDLTGRGLR
nr:ABC transporter ATP-binding protein [Actinomycetospora cinnamomea]